jgi:hypothetical protein
MHSGAATVAPAQPIARRGGWLPRLAITGLLATASLVAAAPGFAHAYPLIGS